MKIILMTLALASSTLFSFLNPGYEEKMKATLKELESSKTVTSLKSAANTFERISKTEQKEWLPLYYSANIHVMLIYRDTTATLAQKDQYLDYAEQLVERMEEISPKEAEVQVLKSFLVLSRIGLSPQDRGPAMYQGYTSALEKAVEYGPGNPRVKYMILAKDVGQAGYFGQDTTPYCDPMKALLESWDTHTVVSDIHPKWGKSELQGLIGQNCK
jgi:hypothetical protein